MKKPSILTLTGLTLSLTAFADLRWNGDEFIEDEFYYADDHEYLYKEYIHINDENSKGYIIVPAAEITGKEKDWHTIVQNERKEMLRRGYAYSSAEDPREIFSIQYGGTSEYPPLQLKLSDLKLAFPYNGLSFIDEKNNLGYYNLSPYSVKELWTGIGQFFKDPNIGICNYQRFNTKLEKVSIRLIAEDVTYEINQKPTSYIIKGSDEVGYSAYIDWHDDTYSHDLQCGTKKFDQKYLSQVLALAIKIDQLK